MMEKESETSMAIIMRNAQESGNPHAFYSGMVFGLGHAYAFMNDMDKKMAMACIQVLLEKIDETHFKVREL